MEGIDVEVLEVHASSLAQEERAWKSVAAAKLDDSGGSGDIKVLFLDETNQV